MSLIGLKSCSKAFSAFSIISLVIEEFKSIYGFPGDGSDLEPGDTSEILTEKLGAMEEKLKDLEGLKEGPGQTQSAITFHPATIAAKKMEKKIKDQLEILKIEAVKKRKILDGVCESCENVSEISNSKLSKYLTNFADKSGMKYSKYNLEFFGLCKKCKSK